MQTSMNGLAADGFVLLGCLFKGTRDVLLIVRAEDRQEVEARLAPDCWVVKGLLRKSPDRTVGIAAAGLPGPLTLGPRADNHVLPAL